MLDGAHFCLDEGFSADLNERFRQVLMALPSNLVRWYQDDLYSEKMSPLLYEATSSAHHTALIKHEMILMIAAKRPAGWSQVVQKYIQGLHKNSFYLFDISLKLNSVYKYDYLTDSEVSDAAILIKTVVAKHSGSKSASPSAVRKIPDSFLPERQNTQEPPHEL